MKKTVLRYGLFSAAFIVLFFFISWMVFGSNENFTLQEIFGYAGIVLALSFVFFGMLHFRNNVNGGSLSFGEGMKLGLLITLIPAIAFGLFNVVYVLWLDPEFMDKYYAHMQSEMQKSLSAADYQEKLKQMESEKELFNNPAVQFVVMFLTVFIVGVIITVISTLILKRRKRIADGGQRTAFVDR
jgi:hypothetical protein